MNGKRILLIDDDALIRRALADYLREYGYEAETAADGIEGLNLIRAQRFDVVLVDLRMPHLDGLEVISILQAERPELPVIVISGTGVLSDAIEAMRRGAWDYVGKPIQDMEETLFVVERVLERARLVAERDRYRRELERLNRSLEAEVARQTEDLFVQNRELAALNRVSYAISDPLDLDTMLHRATDAAVVAIEADGGLVRLLNPATNQLVVAASRGFPDAYLQSAPAIPLGEGVVGQVAKAGHPRAGHDFEADPWLAPLSQTGGFRSYLCVPLRAGDQILGTLGVAKRSDHAFEARDVELLAAIGNQIGVAVARAQYAIDLERANVELEKANADLRRLDTLREQFIQNVAHELRTPLALVRGYVDMLVEGDLEPEEQKVALDVTARRVQALVNLVESISTLQDLDSHPLRLERVVPAELVETSCQMTAQLAARVNIQVCNRCPRDLPPFVGDFTRLAQALHQMLDNACKFSPEGSRVTVDAWAEPDRDRVHFSVTDQGIGVPSEEHKRIFERFYQIDGSTTRRYGGTGLGLALVKEIVEAHGGSVGVESQGLSGEGSTFLISLPTQQERASQPVA